eukprot:187385-Prymnesium_polylepis.1
MKRRAEGARHDLTPAATGAAVTRRAALGPVRPLHPAHRNVSHLETARIFGFTAKVNVHRNRVKL